MFHRFLDWFERHKFGVVGTLMLHTFMLFIMAMSVIEGKDEKPPETDLALELATPEEPAQQPSPEQQQAMLGQSVTNLASNITADAQPSRAAQERIANNVEQDLKAFEKAEFDRLAEERKAAGGDIVVPQLDPSKWDKSNYTEKEVKPVKVEGLTTVSYDLVGRADIVLDVPAYKCKGQGRVVIRVNVDRDGDVSKAEIDAATSTSDDCMLTNALSSAEGARFSRSGSAPQPQRGTITYVFLPQ